MTTVMFFVMVVAIIAVVFYFKYKTSMSKSAGDRSAMEKIISSVGVGARQNLEDAAEKIRTPEISQKEGIQKCKDAIRRLDSDYERELAGLIKRRDDLLEKLPEMKSIPTKYESKARENKKKMEEALGRGENELAEQYKQNALMHLDMKKKATLRVESSEKFIKDIKLVIEKSKIQYERRRTTLDDLLFEFENMHGSISAAKFNDSIDLIKSLRQETTEKLRAQNAEIEAAEVIRGERTENHFVASDYDEEFKSL